MKTPISASKQYVHNLLKPYKSPTTTHPRRLSAAPDSTQPPSQDLTQSFITQLQTTDNWTSDTNLNQQILLLSPQSLLKITRQLESSTKALKFFNFIRNNPFPSPHPPPLDLIFQTVIDLAIREEDYASIASLFNLSKELKISLTPNSAIRLINYFSRVKKVEQSVLVYDELDPDAKNTNVKNIILDLLLKSERFDNARQVFDEMFEPDAKFPPNETTLHILFPVLLRRNWDNMTGIFVDFIPKFGIHGVLPNKIMLTQLITKLCRSYRNDNAWKLLHELMKFGRVEAAPCNALLSGLAKERDYKRINLLLKEMKENEIKPDIVTYGMVVNHLCKSRRVDEALDMFKKMKEENNGISISIKPDVILYNTLIDGLCKVGRQEEGFTLMKQMQLEDNCIPNVITYNCLIDGFCKSGEIERAQELFDQMSNESVSPNVVTINTLVDGMCRHGRISNAIEFFKKMQEEKGIKGNVVTYSTLISTFCSVNNIEKAMSLFDEMESVGSPDALAYYSLISGLTLAGRPDDAYFIASKMKKAGFQMDLVTYNTLIGGFCRKKKLDKAVEILKDMEENGVKADAVTYNSLISYFSQNGDFESAHKFLKQMIIDGNVPTVVTYGTLIHAYCSAGNLDEALDIFEEMLITSKVAPNTVIYNMLIECLCKRGRVDHALSLMDEMLQKGVKPNTTTYNAMLKGLYSKNRLQEALRLMDQMTSQACNPDYVTLDILNGWLEAVGEIEKLRMFVQGYQVSSVASTT